ncbi:MAG: hypothetical protein ACLQBA_27380 [Candidatus Binataceae bacterium]
MKLAQVSREWRVVLGLAMVVIGTANWFVGRQRTQQYSGIIAAVPDSAAEQAYRSFDELGAGADAVLEPFTAEQRRVSYATARMDFYHATFITGEALVIGGAIVICLGFLGLIKRDASHATARRLDLRALGEGPPAV